MEEESLSMQERERPTRESSW